MNGFLNKSFIADILLPHVIKSKAMKKIKVMLLKRKFKEQLIQAHFGLIREIYLLQTI